MATIGEKAAKEAAETWVAETMASIDRDMKREERKAILKVAGCLVGAVVLIIGMAFAIAYAVTLAVRLGWGV